MSVRAPLALLSALAFLACAAPASAASAPAYVGKWGDAKSCKLDQSDQEAPIVMKAAGYDRHETHCKFSGMKQKGDTWSGTSRCQVEGSTQRTKITLKVSGDTLTINEGPGPRTLQRCK